MKFRDIIVLIAILGDGRSCTNLYLPQQIVLSQINEKLKLINKLDQFYFTCEFCFSISNEILCKMRVAVTRTLL